MKAIDFKPYRKNTLRGFFTLEIVGGLQIRDCTLHEDNGRAWFGFPGAPQIEGGQVKMLDGKPLYKNIIFIPDKALLEKVRASIVRQLAEHLDQQSDGSTDRIA